MRFQAPELLPEHLERVERAHIAVEWQRHKYAVVRYAARGADRAFVGLQRLVGYRRRPFGPYQKGSQWFSITEGFARYVLEREDAVRRFFRHSFIPDELFIQSLLIASPYFDNIYDYRDWNGPTQSMRHIDWERGQPYIFRAADFD